MNIVIARKDGKITNIDEKADSVIIELADDTRARVAVRLNGKEVSAFNTNAAQKIQVIP